MKMLWTIQTILNCNKIDASKKQKLIFHWPSALNWTCFLKSTFISKMKQKLHANSFSRNPTLFLSHNHLHTHQNQFFPYFFYFVLLTWSIQANQIRHENGLLIVSQPVSNFDLQRNSTKTLSNRLSIIQGGCRKIAFKLKTFITLFL